MLSLKKIRKDRKGFTLIELLVVVLILGILIAVAIPLYLSSVKNSSKRTTEANLKTIAQAAQAYKVKHGLYPDTTAKLTGDGDLEQWPAGPRDVTYSLTAGGTPTGTTLVISAVEGTDDAFGAAGGGNTATYNMQTGAFSGIEEPAAE